PGMPRLVVGQLKLFSRGGRYATRFLVCCCGWCACMFVIGCYRGWSQAELAIRGQWENDFDSGYRMDMRLEFLVVSGSSPLQEIPRDHDGPAWTRSERVARKRQVRARFV